MFLPSRIECLLYYIFCNLNASTACSRQFWLGTRLGRGSSMDTYRLYSINLCSGQVFVDSDLTATQ